jgi:hypothetical protein
MEEMIIIEGREEVLEVKEKNRSEPWRVHFVFPEVSLSFLVESKVEQLKKIIDSWNKIWLKIAPESNIAQLFGKGSLIIRIDYTLSKEKIFIYEVEESPAGIGLGCVAIEGFREKLNDLGWEKVAVIIPTGKKGGDDYLWTEVIDETEISGRLDSLKWIAPRVKISLPSLKEKSIWPVDFRENKRYLVEMKMAEDITNLSEKEIEEKFNEYANKKKSLGVVLKSDGARAEKVKLHAFKRLIDEVKEWLGDTGGIGVWTFKTIKKEIKQWKSIYLQELIPPVRVIINGERFYGIFRIYFAYSIKDHNWKLLGGFLVTRKSLLIHGASDSCFVPIPA